MLAYRGAVTDASAANRALQADRLVDQYFRFGDIEALRIALGETIDNDCEDEHLDALLATGKICDAGRSMRRAVRPLPQSAPGREATEMNRAFAR